MNYIFFGTVVVITSFALFDLTSSIKEYLQFKQGRNPFNRICKKCGSHQDQYQSNIEGCSHQSWWSEVYPLGNNPDCKCHSYSEDRDW